ncbi:PorP/SprF family type IX secretion system membrane protein [Mucilaginibacter ginkgonis]|uniref:Type IX secretion system membrane protein PorP/SprF n=1 Tax=Mucilaginibacter ginkgonis TaxID=2682091 RepID=A0A6I4HU43_9SPHI|nr:type IX secretion system membrane protein PorP/SprF [Mucilaginibacter ginkgonis]QQL50321.1 type IX secretion system membrane protein PorP/SprF [Mucilaginibacter ginkgonis]
MKRVLAMLAFLFCASALYAQQDVQQSQYMFNGIYINPAYAGYKENLNLHAYYRNQWTGIVGAPVSMSLAVDDIVNDGKVGLAFQIASDKLGAQRSLSAYGNYAYRLRLNSTGSSRLALGFGLGIVQVGVDGSQIVTTNPETNLPLGTVNKILPDGRVGAYFSNDKYYAGISADNLISQYVNVKNTSGFLAQPKPHYYVTAGMLAPISKDIFLKPSFLLKDDRGGPTSLDLNLFLLLGQKLWLGGSYRTGVNIYNKSYLQNDLTPLNSVVAAIEVFPVDNIRIGYGYDFSIGPLAGYSGGTHEISIGFYIKNYKSRMLTPRFF